MKPIEPNRWLLAREVSQLAGISKRTVTQWAASAPPQAKQRVPVRGGQAWQFLLSALPERWRERVAENLGGGESPENGSGKNGTKVSRDPLAAAGSVPPAPAGEDASATCAAGAFVSQGGGSLTYPTPNSAALVPLFDRALPVKVETDLARLDSEAQAQALDRYKLVESTLNGDWKKHLGQKLAGGRIIRTKNDFVLWLADQKVLGPRTLWRWRSQFKRFGIAGLVDRERSDKGASRALIAAGLKVEEVKGLVLRCGGNAREAARQLARQGKPLSYRVIQAIARSIPKPVRTYVLQGPRAFDSLHTPYITRDDVRDPNDFWVIDHVQFDAACDRYPKPQPIFPWATVIMDMASRYVVGWWPSEQPNSFTIAAALRRAIMSCGLPRNLYIDNGKDFRSLYITGGKRRVSNPFRLDFPLEARPLTEQLGIGVVFALPHRPRSKRVERAFRTIHLQFDALFPSYRGTDSRRRVEHCDALLAEHAKQPARSPLPRLEDFLRLFDWWLQHEYNRRPHRGRGMLGRSPADLYASSDRQADAALLNRALLRWQERDVDDRGGVSIQGHRYEAAFLNMHAGHRARVGTNPGHELLPDLTHAVVVCCGQAFEGRSLSAPRTSEELTERLKLQRQHRRIVNDAVRELAGASGHLDPLARMEQAAAAALPAASEPRAAAFIEERPLCLLPSERARFEQPDEFSDGEEGGK